MKKTMMILVALFSVLTLAACGGGDNHSHDENGEHSHDDGDGHDHSGEHHEMGTISIGKFKVTGTGIGEVEAGKEAIFELKVEGEGDTKVTCWLQADKKALSAPTAPEFNKDEGMYDVHAAVPKDANMDDLHLMVRIRAGDFDQTGKFKIEDDDHDHDE